MEALGKVTAWAKSHPALAIGGAAVAGLAAFVLSRKGSGAAPEAPTAPEDASAGASGGGSDIINTPEIPVLDLPSVPSPSGKSNPVVDTGTVDQSAAVSASDIQGIGWAIQRTQYETAKVGASGQALVDRISSVYESKLNRDDVIQTSQPKPTTQPTTQPTLPPTVNRPTGRGAIA